MTTDVFGLSGTVSVVTGGAQGIGLAIARRLADVGSHVVIADRDGDLAAQAAAGLSTPSIGAACDVSNADEMQAVVDRAFSEFGRLDVFVNNAGITRDATLRTMTPEQFDQVIAVHLRGSWLGVKTASLAMRAQSQPGAIVNISSISGKVGLIGQTNYSAAKAGIVGLTKAAAKELGHVGIRVNAVQPGLVRTPMTDALREDVLAAKLAEIPMGRAAEADEVAKAVLFLASDLSSYVTGAVVEVTGGRHM